MIDISGVQVELRCNLHFNGIDFIEGNSKEIFYNIGQKQTNIRTINFNRYTLLVSGYANSLEKSKSFKMVINGLNVNDINIHTTLEQLESFGFFRWVSDVNGEIPQTGENPSFHRFELALNMNYICNEVHEEGKMIDLAFGYNNSDENVLETVAEVVVPGCLKDIDMECTTIRDNSGNEMIVLYIENDMYTEWKDIGYSENVSFRINLSYENSSGVYDSNTGLSEIIPYLSYSNYTQSFDYDENLNDLSLNGQDYTAIAVLGSGTTDISNRLYQDVSFSCLDKVHVTIDAIGYTNEVNSSLETCSSNIVELSCTIGSIQQIKKPLLKWSHLSNDFIIQIPYDNTVPEAETDEKIIENIEMRYIDADGNDLLFETLSSVDISPRKQTTDVSLSYFLNPDYQEYNDISYGLGIGADVELVWSYNNIDNLDVVFGREVYVRRVIMYVNTTTSAPDDNAVLRCSIPIDSNKVIPFTEHICQVDHSSNELTNYTRLNDIFHRVVKEYDGTPVNIGNVSSDAPTSVIYGIMPKITPQYGIGEADYYEFIYVGNNKKSFTSKVEILYDLSDSPTEELYEFAHNLGLFVPGKYEAIQNKECLLSLFNDADHESKTLNINSDVLTPSTGSLTGYVLVKTYAKLDVGVEYDVGVYSHHSKTSLQMEDGTFYKLQDVNCKDIEIVFEPYDVDCSYVECVDSSENDVINSSWVFNLVRYEQFSEPTNLMVSLNDKSKLKLQNEDDDKIQIDVLFDVIKDAVLQDTIKYRISLYDDEDNVVDNHIIENPPLKGVIKHKFVLDGSQCENVWGSYVYAKVDGFVTQGDMSNCSVRSCYDISSSISSEDNELMVLKEPEVFDCDVSFNGSLGIFTPINCSDGKKIMSEFESIASKDNQILVQYPTINVKANDNSDGEYEHINVSYQYYLGSHELTVDNSAVPLTLSDDELNTDIKFRVLTTVESNDDRTTDQHKFTVESELYSVRVTKLPEFTSDFSITEEGDFYNQDVNVVLLKSLNTEEIMCELNIKKYVESLPDHVKLSDTELYVLIEKYNKIKEDTVESQSLLEISNVNRNTWSCDVVFNINNLGFEDTENNLFKFSFLPSYTIERLDLVSDCRYPSNNITTGLTVVDLGITDISCSDMTGDFNTFSEMVMPPVVVNIRPIDPLKQLVGIANSLNIVDNTIVYYFTQEDNNSNYNQTMHVQVNNKDINSGLWNIELLKDNSEHNSYELELMRTNNDTNLYKFTLDTSTLTSTLQNIQLQARANTKNHTEKVTAVSQLDILSSQLFVDEYFINENNVRYEFVESSSPDFNGSDIDIKVLWDEIESLHLLNGIDMSNIERRYTVSLKDEHGNYIKSKETREQVITISDEDLSNNMTTTLTQIYAACKMNNVNVEIDSNRPLLLKLCIETRISYQDSGEQVSLNSVFETYIRISRVPNSPCNIKVIQEDCYSDNPTARLTWEIKDDKYETLSFNINVRGMDKDCSDVDVSFTVSAEDFTRNNKDCHYTNVGKRGDYSYLLKLDGSEHERLVSMYSLSEVKVTREINLVQYTAGRAEGPINVLQERATGTTLTFDYQPNVDLINLVDNSLNIQYDSGSAVRVIGMITYQKTENCLGTFSLGDLSDNSGCNGEYTLDIDTGIYQLDSIGSVVDVPATWQEACDRGLAQITIILINSVGATVVQYKDDTELMDISIRQNYSPSQRVLDLESRLENVENDKQQLQDELDELRSTLQQLHSVVE